MNNRSWSESNKLVTDAIASFPATFQLRTIAVAFGEVSDTFRIDANASYIDDKDDVRLVLERNVNGQWLQFGKVYISELSDFIIPDASTVSAPAEMKQIFDDVYAIHAYDSMTVKELKELTTLRGYGIKNLRDYKRAELITILQRGDNGKELFPLPSTPAHLR